MKFDLQTVALVAIAAALWVAVFEGFQRLLVQRARGRLTVSPTAI